METPLKIPDYDDFINDLENPNKIAFDEVPPESRGYKEIVVDKRTGLPRQAGASMPEGEGVKRFRTLCERSLFVFGKAIMARKYLTKSLHLPWCESLTCIPPYRKLRLLPRRHAKTSIVSHCLPIHILIQSKEDNIYFPNILGSEQRILLAGETERRATDNLRTVRGAFERNQLLKAFWPHVCWEKPRRDSQKWSDSEIIVPRETDYPDPSIRAIGVGGAITGARPTVMIKDDLISVEAANSDVVMLAAIEWHRVSRALLEGYEEEAGLQALEYIIGTRWAVYDLYSEIMDNDPTVDCNVRSIIEDGESIYPEFFNQESIEQLRKEYGTMFFLLYMNSAADPELSDFDTELLRAFTFADGRVAFTEDQRDALLRKRAEKGDQPIEQPVPRGQRLNASTWPLLFGVDKGRGDFMRLKYG